MKRAFGIATLTLVVLAALGGCDALNLEKPDSPLPVPSAPSGATGLGDLAELSGLSALDAAQMPVDVAGFSLYESNKQVRARVRGTVTNSTGKVITSGDLRFKVTVGFDEACPSVIEGSKSLSSLKVSETQPWRPGETREITITSDDHLPGVTGEFDASEVSWELFAYVEDPICWRARGVVSNWDGNWRAATVGSPATGQGLTNKRVSLMSAADGGTRVETMEEGVTVAVVAVKGRKLRVRSPGGVDGWVSDDAVDLAGGTLEFP